MKRNQNNNNSNKSQREEFGTETDFQEVQKQNQQAEMKKQQASGQFAKKNQNSQNNGNY